MMRSILYSNENINQFRKVIELIGEYLECKKSEEK
jgi:hypothetical protein